MSDLKEFAKFMWYDFVTAPHVTPRERAVLFTIPILGIITIVGLFIYAS